MEKILYELMYYNLSREDFAAVVIMCLKYNRGEKITEKDGNEKQILLFKNIAKEKIDKLIKDRKRKEVKRNERKTR